MPRLLHGEVISTAKVMAAYDDIARRSRDVSLGSFVLAPPSFSKFGFLFPTLQSEAANLLPTSSQTREALIALGRTMRDTSQGEAAGDSTIPAAYTYFGQFIDHDVTLDMVSAPTEMDLFRADLAPLSQDAVREQLHNARTPMLDLDNVYGLPAPFNGEKLGIGKVTRLNGPQAPLSRPAHATDDDHDVPREGRHADPRDDRAALIGDPRDDENTVIAQLQCAFLRAHNAFVDQGHSFGEARTLLTQHYQYLVVHDFLKRVADPAVVDDILQNGNRLYNPGEGPLYMPLEFSVAAYRFGHSMVRRAYNFNLNFNDSGEVGTFPAGLELLFTFTALSGQLGNEQLGESDTLPDNWIIEWQRFVNEGQGSNRARKIDTKLVEPLFELRDVQGKPLSGQGADFGSLAVRNLLRGYLLRLPTGQAVAQALGHTPLTAQELETAANDDAQAAALRDGGFTERTPLWYYLLAEAAHGGGQHLGPVGSTIVAEVLIGLCRRSPNSILTRDWNPSLGGTSGSFELSDLLRLAGVLS